jgi:drug/metabolite transporter (DMT)-like permease
MNAAYQVDTVSKETAWSRIRMSGSAAHEEGEALRAGGRTWLPVVMLLVLGTLWGGTFTLSKVAVEGGITVPNINFFFVIGHVPAGVMAVVVATVPMLTYGFALTLGMERFGWRRAAGIGLGLAGALCLLLPRASLPDPAMLGWVVLAFLTPAFYAANSVYSARWRPAGGHSLGLACGMMFGASIFQHGRAGERIEAAARQRGRAGERQLLSALGQIAISSVAYILFFEVLRLAGAVFFSQVAYIVTLAGLSWGMVVFGERHSGWLYLATGLIFAGLALVNLRRRSRPGPECGPRGPSGG